MQGRTDAACSSFNPMSAIPIRTLAKIDPQATWTWHRGRSSLFRLDAGRPDHLAHLPVSSAMSLPNSFGVIGIGTPPQIRACFLDG